MKQYYKHYEICPGYGTTCEGKCHWDEDKQAFECAVYNQIQADDKRRHAGLWARLKAMIGLTPRQLPAGARKFRGLIKNDIV